MTYYLNVYQPGDWPIVEIEIRRSENRSGAGYIGAKKTLNDEMDGLAPAVVQPNVHFSGQYTPTEARELAEWWDVAAGAAETLDELIQTREDLRRPIAARMVESRVRVAFVEVNDDTI